MALFKPYKIQSSQLNSLPKKEGQLIVTTDDKALYIDISNSQRIKVYSDELARIDSLEGIEFAIVESLPTENINEDYIYLIESDSDEVTPSSNITYTISKTGDTITLTGSNNTTSTVSIDNKVDKIDGKGLSTKDFSAAYETKLQGIAEGAQVNDTYTIIESTTTSGYAKTYSLTKNGTEVGTKINIPKDLVIKSGSIKTVTTINTPYTGAVVGDKYLDIELNDSTQNHIYIPVKDLVDVYTAGNGVNVSNANEISIKLDSSNTNGLETTSNGLKLNLATNSAAGAMSSSEKTKLAGIDEGADVNVIETIQLNGTTINPSNKVVNIQVNNLSTQDVQDLIDASITNALEASY